MAGSNSRIPKEPTLVEAQLVVPQATLVADAPSTSIRVAHEPVSAEMIWDSSRSFGRSWVFRICDGITFLLSQIFGIVCVIFLGAACANVPLLQFASLGYLLESSARVARGGKWSSGLVGLAKARKIGAVFLGTWLLLIPVRFFSDSIWYEAYLIDPASPQTKFLRAVQISLIVLTILQIVAAWACGGKFRYFFWQIIAPFSFAIWGIKKVANSQALRPALNLAVGWLSPHLVDDLCRAKSPSDWFVPAILWQKVSNGKLYVEARDGLWSQATSLNLTYYLWLGIKGFAGSFLWLLVPTLLMLQTSNTSDGVLAGLSGVLGSLIAIPVFALLPFIQTHFATDGRFRRFFEIPSVLGLIRRAPLAYLIALLLALAFAIPLFLLKIEEIPAELLWTLSLVFMIFSWPARICIGLAYRRAASREKTGWWWVRYPMMSLTLPISFAFVLIFFFTRYVTWHGGISLFENHVFLLPAPFWL